MVALKHIHMVAVLVTLCFFAVRVWWKITGSRQLEKKWVKVLPHVNDTLLIISAVAMVVSSEVFSFGDNWIIAKLVALLVYILLGMVALHWSRNATQTILAAVGAAALIGYIISVACTKTARGFLSALG